MFLFTNTVNCSVGFYSAVQQYSISCLPCPKGFYSGLVGRDKCFSCPEYMSTLNTGSLNDSACKGNELLKDEFDHMGFF